MPWPGPRTGAPSPWVTAADRTGLALCGAPHRRGAVRGLPFASRTLPATWSKPTLTAMAPSAGKTSSPSTPPTRRTGLNWPPTGHDWLAAPDEDGVSILGSLRSADEPAMLARMDAVYSWLMTRFWCRIPATTRSRSPWRPRPRPGSGCSVAHPGGRPTLAAPVRRQPVRTAGHSTTSPSPGTSADACILSWTGCDAVSADRPVRGAAQSQPVGDGQLRAEHHPTTGTVHDLSRTFNMKWLPRCGRQLHGVREHPRGHGRHDRRDGRGRDR